MAASNSPRRRPPESAPHPACSGDPLVGDPLPLLTGVGIWGYAQYAAGNLRQAGWAFVIYSIVGISTIGHFLGPSPDIPPFFFVTIFTDFLTGTAMLGFGVATLNANRSQAQ